MADEVNTGAANAGEITSELRMGLAMSGAIALVLYEAGVTHEVYRLLRAWRFFEAAAAGAALPAPPPDESGPDGYLQALQQVRLKPVVDILTGASAGGVNSVFLASCIATGQDFAKFHDVWIDTVGVENLAHNKKENAPSLLDNRGKLYETLYKELQKNVANSGGEAAPDAPDMVVRLCRTHLAGHTETTRDAIGHEIDVASKADVLEFGTADFLNGDPNALKKLTNAALATSAFPYVFAPVQDDDGLWYVDGGLWDNQPIDWAVQAVTDKPAFLRTERCIVFVEPNPPAKPDGVPAAEPEPALGQSLSSLPFMGIKGNIWPALCQLLDYNRRSAIYQQMVRSPQLGAFAGTLGGQELRLSRSQCAAARGFAARLRDGSWRSGPAEAPTVLNQVRLDALLLDEDPALIQRWRRLLEQWNVLGQCCAPAANRIGFPRDVPPPPHPDGLAPSPSTPGNPAASETPEDVEPPAPATWAAVAALDVIGEYDLMRRAARRVLDTLNSALRGTREEDENRVEMVRGNAPDKAILYARVEQINAYLYVNPSGLRRAGSPTDALDAAAALAAMASDGAGYHSQLNRFHTRFRPAALAMLNAMEAAMRGLETVCGQTTSTDADVDALLGQPEKNPLLILAKWIEDVDEVAAAARTATHVDLGILLSDLGIAPDAPDAPSATAARDRLTLTGGAAAQPSSGGAAHPQWSAFSQFQRQTEAAAQNKAQGGAAAVRTGALRAARPVDGVPPPSDVLNMDALRRAIEAPSGRVRSAGAVGNTDGTVENAPDVVTGMDGARHILASISDLDGKKPIDLVRVSPSDTNNLYLLPDAAVPNAAGETLAMRKLAGEGLGHLQGFMERRWRCNDYIWGRLDACEILLRTLRMYGDRQGVCMADPEYEAALLAAQDAILKQEAALYDTWRAKNRPRLSPIAGVGGIARAEAASNAAPLKARRAANALLIGYGRETLGDADEPGFTDNMNYIVGTTVKMLQGSMDKPPAALDQFSRFTRILSYPVRWIAAISPPVHGRANARSGWTWMFVVLALSLAAFGCGWCYAHHISVAVSLLNAGYGLIALLAVTAACCGLGYRFRLAFPAALIGGLSLGAGGMAALTHWKSPGGLRFLHVFNPYESSALIALTGLAALLLIAALNALLSHIPRYRSS